MQMNGEKISKWISYLLHPLLMPTVALYLLFQADTYIRFSTSVEMRNGLYVLVFLNTFILPLLVSVLLYRSRQIRSLEMHLVSERIFPFVMTLVFYIGTFVLLKRGGVSYMIYTSFLAATFSVFLILLIYLLLKWKISAHMAGIGGVVGAIMAFSMKLSVNMVFVLMLAILATGVLGYARLRLNAHQPSQVYAGFLIGFSTQLILLL
jgi:membrane-associated phospholipid phosphatase